MTKLEQYCILQIRLDGIMEIAHLLFNESL